MTSRFVLRCPRLKFGAFALLIISPLLACGPDFPESYYAMPTEQLLLAPEGYFAAEIARITRELVPSHRAVPGEFHEAMLEAETQELRQTLSERGVPSNRLGEILYTYLNCRHRLEDSKASGSTRSEVQPIAPDLPAGLPAEFAGYFRGAEAWLRDDGAEADKQWKTVLSLPATERRYRTTWAAYMLGRAALQDGECEVAAPDRLVEAVEYFRQVRVFVKEGFPDRLGLAAASLGWEARAESRQNRLDRATLLYLEQHASGDPTALESLRRTAKAMARVPENSLREIAADPASRRVLTAYIIARGGMNYDDEGEVNETAKLACTWAQTLRAAGVKAVPEADRMAWLAYEGGLFDIAADWAALAPEDVPEARWIRAKLALRDGNLSAAEKLLRSARDASTTLEAHRLQLDAELGRVCLAEDDFSGALAAWVDGGHWQDVGFLAERVMTAAELTTFVDNAPLAPDQAKTLRHILARRLARMGRADAALKYFPVELQPVYAAYAQGVREGFDRTLSVEKRAEGFWRAAQSAKENGLELLATDVEPDWGVWGGYFSSSPSIADRQREATKKTVLGPTETELKRLEEQRPPEHRFHYRYRAAELAWWAASLLPNESEETARILCEAGGWLKARDPESAKPFYQALVIRCGTTEIGRAAEKRRWFPDAKDVEAVSAENRGV